MIDTTTDAAAAPNRVTGTVRDQDGTPVAKSRVELFDSDLFRKDLKLAKGRTGADGTFDIPYAFAKLARRGKKGPDLIVRVLDTAGEVLAASPLIPQAHATCVVHLRVARPTTKATEFERLLQAVLPRLRGRPLAELTDRHVSYLSQVAGLEKEKVARLVASAQCTRDFAKGGQVLPHSAFYAWASQGLPVTASKLVILQRQRLKEALDRALAAGIVPALAQDAVGTLLRHARAAREMQSAPAGEPPSVLDLFGNQPLAGDDRRPSSPLLAEDKRLILAQLRADTEAAATPDAELLAAKSFTPSEIALATRLTSLAELTGNDLALVRSLHGVAAIDADRPRGSLRYLAQLQSAQWRELVGEMAGQPFPDAADRETARSSRAAELEQKIEAAFRTAVIAARIGQNQMAVLAEGRRDLDRFFADNPDFEFGPQSVERAVAEEGGAKLDGIVDLPGLRRSLSSLERTCKLTDNHAQQSVLLASGFDSAATIARVGSRDFVSRMGEHPEIGRDRAELIYARAQQVASVALNLRLRQHDASFGLAVMDRPGASRRSASAVSKLASCCRNRRLSATEATCWARA